MNATWDAVVIGAGPAGSVAARELARRGARVLLVDRAAFPRSKVCGCCLNGAALSALDSIGLGHLAGSCGAVPLTSMHLAAGRISAQFRMPHGVVLSRSAFDLALVREAEAAGATFLPSTQARLEAIEPDAQARNDYPLLARRARPDTRSIRLVGETSTQIAARVVILATGLSNGDSRPSLGSRLGGGTIVPADLAPDFYRPGQLFMATGRGGYVGLVRLEDTRLDVAAAFDASFVRTSGGLGATAEAILSQTRWPAILGLAELSWKGTPALTRRRSAVAEHRLFAVGDAAGYVEPFTGEGMAWAIASAAALAPIALRAIAKWNDSCMREWERVHRRTVRRRQWICRAASHVLRSPMLTGLAVRALSLMPSLSRPVVAALNRPASFQRCRT